MMWKVTFCQQAAKHKKQNQDALFNGQAVFQYQLKKAETIEIEQKNLIVGVADGISNSPKSQLASRFFMQQLAKCEQLNSQWLRAAHQQFCTQQSAVNFGSSSTFVAAQVGLSGKCHILNVGDSRAYRISLAGEWQQLSHDHILLDELPHKVQQEYAGIYYCLSDALIADPEETNFKIFSQTYQLEKGDCLLLCSDGLTDYIPESMRVKVWQHFDNPKDRLTAYSVICEKVGDK